MVKNQKGFTLVEMLIVLLIISVLIIVTIPNVTKHFASIDSKGCEAFVNKIDMKSNLKETLIYKQKNRITIASSDSKVFYSMSNQAIKYEYLLYVYYIVKNTIWQSSSFLWSFLGNTQEEKPLNLYNLNVK